MHCCFAALGVAPQFMLHILMTAEAGNSRIRIRDMPYIGSNASLRSGVGSILSYVSNVLRSVRREISVRLRERRIYNEAMQELWSMPDKYRLELGIDPYEWERWARRKARLASGRGL
jgi:hypothetical protein